MSQRDRLLGRQRPSLPYRLLVDPDGVAVAQQAIERAQQVLRQTRLAVAEAGLAEQAQQQAGDETERVAAQASVAEAEAEREAAANALAAAQAALEGCYETILLRALPLTGEVTVESLIAEHPPTPDQMAKAKREREEARRLGDPVPPWPSWNDDTFRPALLAATADGDMTAEDWSTMLGDRMSTGEVRGLWAACMAVNLLGRAADPVVLPKG